MGSCSSDHGRLGSPMDGIRPTTRGDACCLGRQRWETDDDDDDPVLRMGRRGNGEKSGERGGDDSSDDDNADDDDDDDDGEDDDDVDGASRHIFSDQQN